MHSTTPIIFINTSLPDASCQSRSEREVKAFLLKRKQYFSPLPDNRSHTLKILQILWFTVPSQSTDANSVPWHVQILPRTFCGKSKPNAHPVIHFLMVSFSCRRAQTHPLVFSLRKSPAPASSLKVFKGNLQRLKIFPLTPLGFFSSFSFSSQTDMQSKKLAKLGQALKVPDMSRGDRHAGPHLRLVTF